MAETVDSVRIIDSDKLPEELSGFEGLGKDDRGHLVGIYENGETKGINSLGNLLMKTLVETGLAEEVVPEPESPEVVALRAQVEELKIQLDEERGQHIAEIQALREDFEQQLKQRDARLDDLKKEFDEFRERNTPKPTAPPPGVTLGRGNLKDGVRIRKPGITPPPPPLVPPPAGRRQVIQEEMAWYRRRPATAVLGGLATAAAVVAAGMGIWNHHELEEQESHSPAAAIIPNNGFASPSVLEANGYHLNYYNLARGRKVTGVWLPKDVNLVGSPGSYSIVKDGKVLIKKAQWDSQGELAKSQKRILEKNYNIGWSFLKGARKVSIIVNR